MHIKIILENKYQNNFILINKKSKNNLKNFSVNIPLKKLIAIVGPSGSGKSSLIQILEEEKDIPNLSKKIDILKQKIELPENYDESIEQYNFTLLMNKLKNLSKNDLLILDEPCAGFSKNEQLYIIKKLLEKTKNGFSIIVVEHNKEIIKNSDYVIELGPGSGKYGGKLIFQGTQEQFKNSNTLTSKYIYSQRKTINNNKEENNTKNIKISNIHRKGLRINTFEFPLNKIVCLVGDKNSNRTILLDTIYRSLYKGKDAWEIRLKNVKIDGKNNVRRSYIISQEPLEVNDSNILAKYMDIWYKLKEMYPEKEIENILNLTVEEAIDFFKDIPLLQRKLGFLKEVGLNYVKLGQQTNSFSGGESQRIRIAKILTKKLGDRCVYIFNSPSKGLHMQDLPNIIKVFRKIIDKNNSIIISDNQEEIYQYCDKVILIK